MEYNATIAHIAARFKEPSSWAGIAGLLGVVGIHLDPGMANSVMLIGAGIAGVIAFLMPEKK